MKNWIKRITIATLLLLTVVCNPAWAVSTSLFLMPMPRATFTDINGAPLAGGLLYTCTAGTTCGPLTPSNYKYAYTDSTGATSHTDPIVLDSLGSASIWLDGYYKMVLYDADGNLVWTVDNVSASIYLQSGVTNVDSAGGLVAAVAAAGSTPTTLLIITPQSVTSNLTIPATITLQFGQGGSVTVASGATMTVNGYIQAVPARWFYGQGTTTVNTYPQEAAWWGNSEQWRVLDQRVTSMIGEVKAWAGSTAPSGWMLCYGQAVSRTTYSSLFAVIGTTYGVGDSSTTFNLPDLRGRMLVGVDSMGGTAAGRVAAATTLGYTAGVESHAHTVDVSHNHNVVIPFRGWPVTAFANNHTDELFTANAWNTDYVSYADIYQVSSDRTLTTGSAVVVSDTTELMPYTTDRDFSGANNWANNNLNSFATSGSLVIVASSKDQYCILPVASAPTTAGLTYQLTFDASALTDTWTIKSYDGTQILGTVSANGTHQTINFTASTTGGFRVVANTASSHGTFDNFSLKVVSSTTTVTSGSTNGMNPYMAINYIIRY